ncbi:Predicted short chain-type dehydrogenase [Phaffia rhodozyma]|uniref:Predicted short chain-type dehydrogenase n=1 Tax=Phaffia rhodozyma TaxID=264483 RepID=A0A0F7SJF2_PHARH|nr:Predicted short chain-type dehydrogenase [Phaffia rhodozyma]
MSNNTVYLITGANRGIGFSIVKALASDPGNIIFAGARVPAKAIALHDLAKTSQAKINVVEFVSADTEGNKKAAEEIKKAAGRVDVIIANAGISEPDAFGLVHESDPAQWTTHYNVNVIGVVVLYKEFYSLLHASIVAPKFIVVSSGAGSAELAFQFKMPLAVYGASKAAVNYTTVKMHLESEESGLIVFPLSPGVVSSDMGNASAKKLFPDGSENALAAMIITPDESAQHIVKLVKEATRETHGGKHWNYDGTVLPW